MKTYYVVRNARTGKYLRRMLGWGKLDALETVVLKKADAERAAANLVGPRQRFEIVPIQLLRL